MLRDLQGLNYGRRCHCSRVLRLLSGSPRAPRTLLCSHYAGNVRAFPSTPLRQLWLLKNGVHSTRSFLLRNVLGLNFLVAFSDWGGSEAGERSNTRAHADQRRERGPAFPSSRPYTEQPMSWDWKMTERKKQERGAHTGIIDDMEGGGVTTAEVLARRSP